MLIRRLSFIIVNAINLILMLYRGNLIIIILNKYFETISLWNNILSGSFLLL